ncbi:MAG: peptidylprolyl isomerase [Mucilaginibacter sp.]|nr:peptidylprolyl isomerase [Mucilaginibacter sp.]
MKKYILYLFITVFAINANAQGNFQRTSKGTQYQLFTHNTGDRIKLNDIVTFQATQKTDKDSILFSSYKAGAPLQAQIQAEGDLMDIFPLLTLKDSVLIKVPTDSIFKNNEQQRPPFLPKGSNMYFTLKIEKVQTLDEAMAERKAKMDKYSSDEVANTDKYIAEHKLILKATPSGLKYLITAPSVKRKPLAGDTVWVNYTGRTLDGKVFDSSVQDEAKKAGLQQPGRTYEPIKFAVGSGMVIPGWDEGLLLLNEGSKAVFVIPSKLAYGEKGAGEDIKPFSTLLFDIELVKVKPVKHALPKTAAKKPLAKKPVAKKPGVAAKKKVN